MLQPEQLRAVALAAVEFLRHHRPGRHVLGPRLVPRRRRLLLREVLGQLVHLGVGQVRRHRRHLRVLAVARAEHE